MNFNSFILGGLAGGLICNLCGMLFYGMLFSNYFPDSSDMNMTFILLGGFAYGFFISYIYNRWTNISNWKTGLSSGITLGAFNGLVAALYGSAEGSQVCYTSMFLEFAFSAIYTALMGMAIAMISSRVGHNSEK